MTLQEAVELLCGQDEHFVNASTWSRDGSFSLIIRQWTDDNLVNDYELGSIDGCLALGRELGLEEIDNREWVLTYRTNLFCLALPLFQAALAAGIEHLYKERS